MVPNAWLTRKWCFFGHLNLIITLAMHSISMHESFIYMKCCQSIGSENPWVGVFLNNPLNLSNASLKDSSGNWWNEEIVAFPYAILDSGKYFFRKFSITSSQDLRLLPLNEWSHLLASPANGNENRLSLIASSGTPTILIVLHISMNIAKCA